MGPRSQFIIFTRNKPWLYKNWLKMIFLRWLPLWQGAREQGVNAPGGVLPMWWVIHMCRGFDPLFSLWQDRARSFWGIFSHPPTPKRSFGVLKLPILTEFDLFGPKFNFFLDLFGSNFQRPAAHPHQFSGRVPPPGLTHLVLGPYMPCTAQLSGPLIKASGLR